MGLRVATPNEHRQARERKHQASQHDHHCGDERRKWVYRHFEGLIWHPPEVYCRFEGLLKDETPSIGVEISTPILGVFAYISPSKRQ